MKVQQDFMALAGKPKLEDLYVVRCLLRRLLRKPCGLPQPGLHDMQAPSDAMKEAALKQVYIPVIRLLTTPDLEKQVRGETMVRRWR